MSREMLVDVDIPIDIEGAFDPDGLPKVVSKPQTTLEPRRRDGAPAPVLKSEDFERLRGEVAAERTARTKAEADAAAAAAARKTIEDQLRDTHGKLTDTTVAAYGAHYAKTQGELQQIQSALASTKALADSAEATLTQAETQLADPNLDPAVRADIARRKVQAQRDLSRAEAEMVTLEAGKGQAESAAATAKRYWEDSNAYAAEAARAAAAQTKEPEVKKDPPASQTITPDQWIDSCPATTRPWLREHKEFTTDAKLHRRLTNFATDYIEDNGGDQSVLDSQDFIAALNAKFFPKAQEDDNVGDDQHEEEDPAPAPTPRTRSAPAAPVSRGSNPGNGTSGSGSGSRIRLSADEQSVAMQMYPNDDRATALKRYATNKAKAIADGRYAPRG